MLLYFLIAIDVLFLAAAHMLIKKGVLLLGSLDLSLAGLLSLFFAAIKNFYILGGLTLLGFCFLLWLFILQKINLNILYPISSSLTLILVIIGANFFFKETLNWVQLIGIALIVLGIFLLYFKQ